MLGIVLAVMALLSAVVLGPLWWLRRRFVVVVIEGRSMEPGYQHGDRLLVRRVPPAVVRVGDVVVFDDWDRGDRLIKRVAALPGERVPIEVAAFRHWPPDTLVPAGHLVVLGDNPASSLDSRQRGFFPVDRLLGVAVRPMRVTIDGRRS